VGVCGGERLRHNGQFTQDLLYWQVVQIGNFPKKLKNLCDVTQYAYAESQVTLALNLVTLNVNI
jgi:hypothetical protein